MAVSRVTEWAVDEIERLPEGSDARNLTTMLQELPTYGSPRWGDFNETCLIPLLKGLKEGSIGRKHKESEGVLLTDCQRAQKVRAFGRRNPLSRIPRAEPCAVPPLGTQAQETLEHMALVVMHKAGQLFEDAQRMSADDPAKAVRATKLLNKQAHELSKLSGCRNELPTDFTPPVAKMARLGPSSARAGSALLAFAREHAARAEGDAESDASGEEEDDEPPFCGPPALQGPARAAAVGVGAARGGAASSAEGWVAPYSVGENPDTRLGAGRPAPGSAFSAPMWRSDACEQGLPAAARCFGGLRRPAEEEEPSASQSSLAHYVEDLASQDCAQLMADSQSSAEMEDEPACPAARRPTPGTPPHPPLAPSPAEPSCLSAATVAPAAAPAPAPAGEQSVKTQLYPPHPAPSTSSPARLNAGPARGPASSPARLNAGPARGPAAASKRSGGANDIMTAAHGLRALRAMAGGGAAAGADASTVSGPDAEEPKSVVDDVQARGARVVHTRSRGDALSSR